MNERAADAFHATIGVFYALVLIFCALGAAVVLLSVIVSAFADRRARDLDE